MLNRAIIGKVFLYTIFGILLARANHDIPRRSSTAGTLIKTSEITTTLTQWFLVRPITSGGISIKNTQTTEILPSNADTLTLTGYVSQGLQYTDSKTLGAATATINAQTKSSKSEERLTHVVASTQVTTPEKKLYDQTHLPDENSTMMPTTVNIYLTTTTSTLYQSNMLHDERIERTPTIPNSEKQFVISASNSEVIVTSTIENFQKLNTISEIRPTQCLETLRVPTSIQEHLTTDTNILTNSAFVESTKVPTSTEKYLTSDILSSYHSQSASSNKQFEKNLKSETLFMSAKIKESNLMSMQSFIQNSVTTSKAAADDMSEPLSTSYQSPQVSNDPFMTNSKLETVVLSTTITKSSTVLMQSVSQTLETTSYVRVEDMSKTLSDSYKSMKTKETASDVGSTVLSATSTATLEQFSPWYTSTSQISTTTKTLTVFNETNEPTLPSTHAILDAAQLTISIDLDVEVNIPFVQDLTEQSSAKSLVHERSYLAPFWGEKLKFENKLTTAFGTIVDFSGILIRNFSKGSVICNFGLQLQGNCNLGDTEDEFTRSFNLLESGSIFGAQIQFNKDMMLDRFSAAAQQQATGDVCEIYVDITLCKHGYTCQSIPPWDKISCSLDCKYLPTNCLTNGGTCAFDNVRRMPFCRCVTFSGDACEIRNQQTTEHLTTGNIIAITFGIVATFLAIPGFIVWVNKCLSV